MKNQNPMDIHQPFFSEKILPASEAQKLEREQDKGVGVSFVHISCFNQQWPRTGVPLTYVYYHGIY